MNYRIYSDKSIFEDIILNDSNWKSIISLHADNFLNISDDEIENELSTPDDSIIAQIYNITGGRVQSGNDDFFNTFATDPTILEKKVCATFFIDKTDKEIIELQNRYGVSIQNRSVNEQYFSHRVYKELSKGEIIKQGNYDGWKSLISEKKFNSLLLTDPYLFHNEEGIRNVGVSNVIDLLDAFLPLKIEIPIHILIISSEPLNKAFSNEKAERIYNELREELSSRREYTILLELVFTKNILHKRRIYTNDLLIKCDKGFNLFSTTNKNKCRDDNDIEVVGYFKACFLNDGDPQYVELRDRIQAIKKGVTQAIEWIRKFDNSPEQKCFGLSSPDYQIQNRIFNYFK